MTTLEQIRKVRTVLGTNQQFKSADSISKATGTSYNFLRAMIDQGLVSKENGRYVWSSKRKPNVRTYNKLKQAVSSALVKPEKPTKQVVEDNEVVLSFNNTVDVKIVEGSAVISRNGVKIEVQDLANLEKFLKVLA